MKLIVNTDLRPQAFFTCVIYAREEKGPGDEAKIMLINVIIYRQYVYVTKKCTCMGVAKPHAFAHAPLTLLPPWFKNPSYTPETEEETT